MFVLFIEVSPTKINASTRKSPEWPGAANQGRRVTARQWCIFVACGLRNGVRWIIFRLFDGNDARNVKHAWGGSGNESRATVIRDGGGSERTTKRGDGDDSWTAANASGRRSGGGGGGNERAVRELFRRRWPANECVPIAEGQGYLYPCRAAAGSPGPPPERRRRGRTSRARARPMSDAFSVRRDARARDRSFRRLKLRRGRVGAPYKLNSFKRQ